MSNAKILWSAIVKKQQRIHLATTTKFVFALHFERSYMYDYAIFALMSNAPCLSGTKAFSPVYDIARNNKHFFID